MRTGVDFKVSDDGFGTMAIMDTTGAPKATGCTLKPEQRKKQIGCKKLTHSHL